MTLHVKRIYDCDGPECATEMEDAPFIETEDVEFEGCSEIIRVSTKESVSIGGQHFCSAGCLHKFIDVGLGLKTIPSPKKSK